MVDMPQIPLYKVHMPSNMAEVLDPVLKSGYITQGPRTAEFEKKFQEYIGNPNTAIINSGTSALTIALRLAGVGPGTSVVSSPLTCIATNEPILSLGADIEWCDIDPRTGNIDADKIEECITERTKAIMFVDLAGIPAELDKINEVAKKHGIRVIEDAAHAMGARYRGNLTGTQCDTTCFSFQAIKHLSTVDGGALACKTKEDYDRAVLIRWFGMSRGHNGSPVCWEGDVLEYGYKNNLNDVNATVGLEQLKYIDNIVKTHKRNGALLLNELKGISGLDVCEIPSYTDPSFWIFPILLNNSSHRESVSSKLISKGISNSISQTRNDVYSIFSPYKKHLPNLDIFSERVLNIPCGWWCSLEDISYIVDVLKKSV